LAAEKMSIPQFWKSVEPWTQQAWQNGPRMTVLASSRIFMAMAKHMDLVMLGTILQSRLVRAPLCFKLELPMEVA